MSIHNISATGSYIAGTNGTSNGIVPMLRVFNDTARYVDQGGGKRKGSFAIYVEPWHADIFDFLELKKNHTLVVVEHDMSFIDTISEKVTVLAQGAILAEGTLAEVQANEDVIEKYLGR